MAEYEALVSFGGKFSMRKGDVTTINDADIVKDLLNAGYIKEVSPAPIKAQENEKKETKKRGKRK